MRVALVLVLVLVAGCATPDGDISTATSTAASANPTGPDGSDTNAGSASSTRSAHPSVEQACDPAAGRITDARLRHDGFPTYDEALEIVRTALGTGPFTPLSRTEHDTYQQAGNVTFGASTAGGRTSYEIGIAQWEADRGSAAWAESVAHRLAIAFFPLAEHGTWSNGTAVASAGATYPSWQLTQASWPAGWERPTILRAGVTSQYGWQVKVFVPLHLEGAPSATPLTPQRAREAAHAYWRCAEPANPEFQYDDVDAAVHVVWSDEADAEGRTVLAARWGRPDRGYVATPSLALDPWTGAVLWSGSPSI